MQFLTRYTLPIVRAFTHPVTELNRWQRSCRWFIELMRHCWRQLNDDRAEEMAAALTFRTVFSLIPLLVLGLVIFRVFGGFSEVKQNLEEPLFKLFGVFDVPAMYEQPHVEATAGGSGVAPGRSVEESHATQPAEVVGGTTVAEATVEAAQVADVRERADQAAARAQAAAEAARRGEGDWQTAFEAREEATRLAEEAAAVSNERNRTVQASIREVLANTMGEMSQLNFGALGVTGLALFLYAAMTLAFSIEYDFNIIFKAPAGRPWHLRLPIYWSMITLGILLLALTFWLTGAIQRGVEEFVGLDDAARDGWLTRASGHLFALFTSFVMLFLLYVLMPNTKVKLRPAMAGAIVASVLWEAGKIGFQYYVNRALPYSALYGTIGLIPLFLFWVYISWLIVLFGLELTYALQMMRGRWHQQPVPASGVAAGECEVLLDPRWLVPVMAAVGECFARGETVSVGKLAERLSLPSKTLAPLVDRLKAHGLLHQVIGKDQEDPGYTLSQPPGKIEVATLLKLGQDLSMHGKQIRHVPGGEMLEQITAAERAATNGATLANLVPGLPQPAAAGGNGHAPRVMD